MILRNVSPREIAQLQSQGCSSADWKSVMVTETGFSPDFIFNAKFSGKVILGKFEKEFELPGGILLHSGIYDAKIHNCTIGDDALISSIRNYIANYEIGEGANIINCNLLTVNGESTFGNGTRISVLNETGGRLVPIYENMSAHSAYILALYRHCTEAIEQLTTFIDDFAASRKSQVGKVGKGATIINCHEIINTAIGEYAELNGVTLVENGTILSLKEAPTKVGHGVVMKDFILGTSSSVEDGTIIEQCFIGEGCEFGKQYSAENSLFFANCLGMHGEACAIFAGPYTVTHHKATLLIAGYFSFLNAGSGTNQSNHMYKLGPIHQGIVERGSKTSSDSYVLWPARIGAFSLIMGRHTNHPDTSDLPFSYLIEKDNKTKIVPGANLRSVGTIRDAKKWPKRDKRKATRKIDQINFNLLSPYTIQKMIKGLDLLKTLQGTAGETSDFYTYYGARIQADSLRKGIKLYQMAINKFVGNSLISRLGEHMFFSVDEMHDVLRPNQQIGNGKWLDVCGLIAPKSEIDLLIEKISAKKIDLGGIQHNFEELHKNYYDYEWTWAANLIEQMLDKPLESWSAIDMITLIETWITSVTELDKELYNDARKEFTLIQRIGYGIDGGKEEMSADFEHVRGEFESNDFVHDVLEHIEKKTALGHKAINRLRPLTR